MSAETTHQTIGTPIVLLAENNWSQGGLVLRWTMSVLAGNLVSTSISTFLEPHTALASFRLLTHVDVISVTERPHEVVLVSADNQHGRSSNSGNTLLHISSLEKAQLNCKTNLGKR